MKIISVGTIVLLFCASLLAAEKPVATPAQAGFDKLASLVGQWQGKTRDGSPIEISIEPVAAGSALMQTDHTHDHMVTLYHLDGDRLMLTHYCEANNQPRLRAQLPATGGNLEFSFLDGTNMTSPKDGHIDHLVISFRDKDHFSEHWTFRKDGKDVEDETYDLARKN